MREVIATGKTVEEATENGCQELGLSRDEVSVEILEFPQKKLFKNMPAKVKVTADNQGPILAEDEKPAPASRAEAALRAEAQPKKTEKAPAKTENKEEQPPRAERSKNREVLPKEQEEPISIADHPRVAAAAAYMEEIFGAMDALPVEISAFRQGDATLLRVEGSRIGEKMEVRGEVIQALSYLIDRAVNAGVDKKDDAYLRVRLDIAGYRSRREVELLDLANRTGNEVAKTGRSRTLAPMNPYERLIVHTAISQIEGITSESIGADTERRVVVKSLAANATDGEDWRPPRNDSRGGAGRHERGDRRPGGGNRSGGPRRDGDRGRGGNRGGDRDRGPRMPQSSTPEREYADTPRDPNAQPVVPQRRDAIKDGDDLPLYGKIEL